MSISQIGVFVENHPGHVARVLDAFVEAEVQVRGYCMSDTGDYGIVRFVVDNPEKAKQVLADMGCAVVAKEVLCLRLADRPGELARIMARRYGDQSFKEGENQDPSEEMADILWVLMALANQTGVDLTEALQKSIEKKTKRDATRHKNNPKLTADKKEKDL